MAYPRTPAAIKQLRGNPGHRPIRGEVDAGTLAKLPDPPDWIEGESRVFYRRMGRELVRLGILARVDVPALVALASAWGRWVQAERELRVRGPVITTATGAQQINPWQSVSLRALDRFCDLLAQFGGTPASRTRIALKESGESAADDLASLLFGRVQVVNVPAQLTGPEEDFREWLPAGDGGE